MELGNQAIKLASSTEFTEYVQAGVTLVSVLFALVLGIHKYISKKDTSDALDDKRITDVEDGLNANKEAFIGTKDRVTELESKVRLLEERISQQDKQVGALFKMVDKFGDKLDKTLDLIFSARDK
jgi:septal ring factor EnvC (AmiA/AmiB activator)